MRPQFFDLANTSPAKNLLWYFGLHWALTRFSFNPQFQSFKLLFGHALQSHRCGQIQSGNVFHFAAVCYLATECPYFWVSAHFQKHFIRIGNGQSFLNQAMLSQNAMIRGYCQRRRMGLRSGFVLFSVLHLQPMLKLWNCSGYGAGTDSGHSTIWRSPWFGNFAADYFFSIWSFKCLAQASAVVC